MPNEPSAYQQIDTFQLRQDTIELLYPLLERFAFQELPADLPTEVSGELQNLANKFYCLTAAADGAPPVAVEEDWLSLA